jgi:hypothetical protein
MYRVIKGSFVVNRSEMAAELVDKAVIEWGRNLGMEFMNVNFFGVRSS